MKIHNNNDETKQKGFDCQYLAEKFAKQVGGTVKFSPLPDYMGMIPFWIVTWKEQLYRGGFFRPNF